MPYDCNCHEWIQFQAWAHCVVYPNYVSSIPFLLLLLCRWQNIATNLLPARSMKLWSALTFSFCVSIRSYCICVLAGILKKMYTNDRESTSQLLLQVFLSQAVLCLFSFKTCFIMRFASSCLCKLQKLSTLSVVSVCETNNLHETDCVLLFSDFFFIVAW